MSKQRASRKKKLDQPQPIIEPPTNPTLIGKINSRVCLISPIYNNSSDKDYRQFLVKRKYCKKLEFASNSYYWYARIIFEKRLLRVYPKMKYLKELYGKGLSLETRDKFYATMRRIRSYNLELMVYNNTPDSFVNHIINNTKRLPRLDLVQLKIKINASYHQTHKTIYKALEGFANSLKYMSNLKSFSFELVKPSYESSILGSNPITVNKKVSSRFKRLKKIEKLKLIFQKFPRCILDSFIQDFSYLSNLKNVKFIAADQAHGKQLIESLYKVQTLTSVTLYEHFEPDNILLLAIKVPSLKSITIKDDWLFESKKIPSLSAVSKKGLSVVRLHFKFPMDIDFDEDVEFLASFLSPFTQIKSLNLNIRSGSENQEILAPIGKQISKFSKIQRLTLGVLAQSKGIVSPFLSSIDSLTNLKDILLTLKRDYKQGWEVEIQELYQALKIFILQSKDLTNFNLNWDKFNQQCAECLKLVMHELGSIKLDSMNIAYVPLNTKHGKPHEKTLRVIENLFVKSPVEIKNVTIGTSCSGQRTETCRFKLEKIQKVVESNPNINNFMIRIPRFNVFFKNHLY